MVRRVIRVRNKNLVALDSRQDDNRLWRIAADAVTANVAVLDQQGEVVAVNEPWRQFALTQGGESDYVGTNYLTVCEAAGDVSHLT